MAEISRSTVEASRVDKVRRQGKGAVIRELGQELLRVRRDRRWGNPWGYILALPPVLLYAVFQVYPIVRGLIMAFQDYRYLIPESRSPFTSFNGLGNWIELFQDHFFWSSLKVSVLFALGDFTLSVGLGLFVAVVIAYLKGRFLAVVTRVITYLPVVLPMAVAMRVWTILYSPTIGYVNHVIESVLGIQQGPTWLGYDWALVAVIIASVWKNFGFKALLFLVGLYGINQELYEAAAIDGAGAWSRFLHVTLPGLKPMFALVFVLGGGAGARGLFSATAPMMLLTDGGPADATLSAGLYAYRVAFEYGDMRLGYASTIVLLLGLMHLGLSSVIFRTMRVERA
ncbi:MAG: sugar ABC transporter permease [Candidatus Hydrogenedentota bacterium]|nr:MAG: sugar ABC transporter permease [Candidatus Hydrogenedentota bacterium]